MLLYIVLLFIRLVTLNDTVENFDASMMMIIVVMSMGLDYVSELRPPTGLLFISQVMYGCGEPWWNDDVNRGELLDLSTRALWHFYQQSHQVASRKNG
jgi:hypothetical protein